MSLLGEIKVLNYSRIGDVDVLIALWFLGIGCLQTLDCR